MYFQTFHDLIQYADANPDDFNSVSLDLLEKFMYDTAKQKSNHNEIPLVNSSQDSGSSFRE